MMMIMIIFPHPKFMPLSR